MVARRHLEHLDLLGPEFAAVHTVNQDTEISCPADKCSWSIDANKATLAHDSKPT
jgi:hypothetical protein